MRITEKPLQFSYVLVSACFATCFQNAIATDKEHREDTCSVHIVVGNRTGSVPPTGDPTFGFIITPHYVFWAYGKRILACKVLAHSEKWDNEIFLLNREWAEERDRIRLTVRHERGGAKWLIELPRRDGDRRRILQYETRIQTAVDQLDNLISGKDLLANASGKAAYSILTGEQCDKHEVAEP